MAIPGFANWPNETVTIEPFSSEDGAGKRSYGTAVPYAEAYVERSTRKYISPSGAELVQRGTVFIGPELAALDPRSRVTLTGETLPAAVLGVDSFRPFGELHHWEIYFA